MSVLSYDEEKTFYYHLTSLELVHIQPPLLTQAQGVQPIHFEASQSNSYSLECIRHANVKVASLFAELFVGSSQNMLSLYMTDCAKVPTPSIAPIAISPYGLE